jgi:hypothetical protein
MNMATDHESTHASRYSLSAARTLDPLIGAENKVMQEACCIGVAASAASVPPLPSMASGKHNVGAEA